VANIAAKVHLVMNLLPRSSGMRHALVTMAPRWRR
jgi:hypothetical protein